MVRHGLYIGVLHNNSGACATNAHSVKSMWYFIELNNIASLSSEFYSECTKLIACHCMTNYMFLESVWWLFCVLPLCYI